LHDPNFLQKAVVDLPDLFVCHTRKLKSTEIIMKKEWLILRDNMAYGLLSQETEKFNLQ
jgi:hypothetical protein